MVTRMLDTQIEREIEGERKYVRKNDYSFVSQNVQTDLNLKVESIKKLQQS